MQFKPFRILSQSLKSLLSVSAEDQQQTLGGHKVETQKVYKERMDEFRYLAKEAKELKVPHSNRFTAYDPKTPIGGNLL